MRSPLRTIAALCSIALSVNTSTGCSGTPVSSGEITAESGDASAAPVEISQAEEEKVQFTVKTATEKDMTPQEDCSSKVIFSDSGIVCNGSGVSAAGNTATITKAGTYAISGSGIGQLVIDCSSDDKVYLVLDGLDLSCEDGPAIYCKSADKLTITLADGTSSTLSDGTGNSDDTGAAIFSEDTLVINGGGSLFVNGVYKDGIKSKDGLKLCGGNISVTAAEDGIIGKDYVLAAAGSVTLNSGCDGIKSTCSDNAEKGYISITGGEYHLVCGNNGFQAETVLCMTDGAVDIVTGGGSSTVEYTTDNGGRMDRFFADGSDGFDFSELKAEDGTAAESMKGLKAGGDITISGGTITADCADDAVHSNGSITIDGGIFTLASGDDGIHSDVLLTITDGEIFITQSYEGLEAVGITISGGTISVRAADDGVNACGSAAEDGFTPYIAISGGSLTSNADGDGIDSNGTISMSGGTLVVFGPTDGGNGALDYDQSFALSGGTLIALGSRGMAQAPSTLSQPCLSIYGNVEADSTLEVRSADGDVIISITTPKMCESLIFSTPDLVSGQDYSIYCGDELLSTVTATDGVSGNGATGSGFGAWSQNGGRPWGGDHGGFPNARSMFTQGSAA